MPQTQVSSVPVANRNTPGKIRVHQQSLCIAGVYWKIMPDYLPWPLALVYVSGFFEVLGGARLAVQRMRRAVGLGLIALLVAVFPANIQMLMNADEFPAIPFWAMVDRLPFQGVLIAWVWWVAVKRPGTWERAEDEI